jgi:vancomycin resistance protein YoaR
MRKTKHNDFFSWAFAFFGVIGILLLCGISVFITFQRHYQGKIYPNVTVDGVSFADQTPEEVKTYWLAKNNPFSGLELELTFNGKVATISGSDLNIGYDATMAAVQAYGVGRSGSPLSNLFMKISRQKVNLSPYFRWNDQPINDALDTIEQDVNIPIEDALFTFAGGRVTAFRPSKDGRALSRAVAITRIHDALFSGARNGVTHLTVPMPIEVIHPSITTDRANSFGIKELIGMGYSEFAGSIPGRIHNVALAASRINGVLIKPGETFSFNDTVGDISAATGYQSAYIIKDGRTVLGDGGGVCQVSTTLFRAALAAGLPIVERHAHAYRVHYYEEGGFAAGMDATVYSPSYDLKFKNNTPGYILIQTKTDIPNLSLTFELYGTRDSRVALISNQKLWDVTAPPPDLFQDDPTLPKGTTKQVDFAAWGAKASFDYTVTRGTETLENTTFVSNFRPWQAVYLKGTL